ncbi:MAG: molybdopterin dinucleotide binding domain-containing protein [Planctomycetaceae bacterium]|jgi:formylmethanofuran dehydrogenase subunit D
MPAKRFILNPSRTSKQGVGINLGKFTEEYALSVSVMTMHPNDMASIGASDGDTCRVSTEEGEATFKCTPGKVPEGLIFVPYGPATCQLMGGSTDGTGMPLSKGWEVEVEPIASLDRS